MKLDEQGAAFFVEGYDADEAEAIELATHPELATSPIPESGFPPDFIKAQEKLHQEKKDKQDIKDGADSSSSSELDRKGSLTDNEQCNLPMPPPDVSCTST